MRSKAAALLLMAVVALGGLHACAGPVTGKSAAVQAPPGGLVLKGAGATFPSLLFKEWFAEYPKEHPKIGIAYAAVGSGEGIRRFTGKDVDESDKVDFGASDAAMTDEQIAAVPEGVVMLPVTAGSVVLGYNLPDLEGPLCLSRKAYAGIFLGTIKTWDDPLIAKDNPGSKLPKLTIVTVVRQDGSGTTYAFTKHLDAISETWRSQHGASTLVDWPGNAMRAAGNEGVAGRIQHSVGSIGYLNYGSARQVGLRMAVVENREGAFVEPTSENAAASLAAAELPENLRLFMPDPVGPQSYPIVTFSWALVHRAYEDRAKAAAIHDLFRWALTEGQAYGADKGYIPLPARVSAKALAALDASPSAGPS
jgi:phosphate transport system substrate-binding protein